MRIVFGLNVWVFVSVYGVKEYYKKNKGGSHEECVYMRQIVSNEKCENYGIVLFFTQIYKRDYNLKCGMMFCL